MLHELSADVGGGHNILSTVFIEARSMYRKDGPEELKPVGEIEFVQGLAAASASGLYGRTKVAAAIVGHANNQRVMKLRLVILAALLVLLAACSQAPTPAPAPSDVTPCRLKQAEQSLFSSGFPISSIRMSSTGSPRVAVLFVDFPNVNAVNSTESVFSKHIPGAENYLETMSSGKLDLQFEPLHKWLRMSGELESYDQFEWLSAESQARFMQEAVDLADPDFDFSEIDSVIVIADEKALSFPSIVGFSPEPVPVISGLLPVDGNVIRNGVLRGADYGDYSAEAISHEMGHIMGLPDTYEVVDISTAYHTHVGNFGIMGQIVPMDFNRSLSDRFKGNEMLAWHRWQLGWIEDSEVFCATSSTTSIKLGPLTKNLGSRMLAMPVDSSRVLVAENRAIDGYDQNLSTGGILVYSVDERIATGKGPIKVQGDYSADWPDSSVLLQPGEKITVAGYEISVTSKVGNNYFIEISTP